MEIAIILTNADLSEQVEGPVLCVKVPDALLDSMDEWCTKHHGESGLTDRCRTSAMTLAEASEIIIEFMNDNGVMKGKGVLAGNTVHMDKLFIEKDLPDVAS